MQFVFMVSLLILITLPTGVAEPLGLRATLVAGRLDLRDGAVKASMQVGPKACAAVIDLAEGGAEQGLWLSRGGSESSLLRLRPDGTLQTLYGSSAYVSHGIAGSDWQRTMLIDLDADGRFELIERRSRRDDSGSHDEPPIIYARGDGPFERKKGFKAPRESALYLGDRDPVTKAIGATTQAPVNLLGLASMSLAAPLGDCSAGIGGASPPSIGSTYVVVAYPRADAKKPVLPLTLHVVRPFDSPPRVLASAPIGAMSETFTSDACRIRARVGTPLVAVQPSQRDPKQRIILAIFPSESTRLARAFRWDGKTLTESAPIELDRCDTPARSVVFDESDNILTIGDRMTVDISHVGTWYGKPPLKRLDLDVTVRNPGPTAQWLFIPGTAGEKNPGGVYQVTIYETPGWLWRIEGPAGGWAVKVAPGTEATLRKLGVEIWFDPPADGMTLPAVLADDVLIGGQSIATFVGADPALTTAGINNAQIDRMRSTMVRTKSNPREPNGLSKESPLGFTNARTTVTPVAAAAMPWPKRWAELVGKTVTLEGKALDAKSGALLAGEGGQIWIDALQAWPAGFYEGGDRGKRVRVTGVVIEKADLPVFVAKKGEPQKAGIPVAEGTDLEQAAKRYLLKDAKWVLLKP